MLKRIVIAFLSFLLAGFFYSCPVPGNPPDDEKEVPSPPPAPLLSDNPARPDNPRNTWTVLVHFAIDNNIDWDFEANHGIVTNYLAALETVEAHDVSNKINIVVLMDCYNHAGYTTSFQDGYYRITGNPANDLAAPAVPFDEINSGSVAVTEAFMDWAVENCPADGYLYSIFNHGGGFNDYNIGGMYSIGFDDSNNDCLSHNELGAVTAHLKNLIGHNIDLFFPYACLMGGMELAYEVRRNADYLLFSEQLFPADLWSFEALETIVGGVPVSAFGIGKAFCDSAYAYFSAPEVNRRFTLSLICLPMVDNLAIAADYFARTAVYDINLNSNQNAFYLAALFSSPAYGYYIDLGDYLCNIKNSTETGACSRAAADFVTPWLSDSVVYMKNFGYPSATGLTIFHNIWWHNYYNPQTYKGILSFGSNSWTAYVELMDSLETYEVPGDAYDPDNDFTTTNTILLGQKQNHTLDDSADADFLKVNLRAGVTYKIETYFLMRETDTELYLYDGNQNQLVYDDDDGTGYYSLIIFPCTRSGSYFVRAQGYKGCTGDYSIDVDENSLMLSARDAVDKSLLVK